jgi:hypothetical protein
VISTTKDDNKNYIVAEMVQKKKGNFKQVNLHPSFIDRLIRLVKHEKNPYLVKKTLMQHF